MRLTTGVEGQHTSAVEEARPQLTAGTSVVCSHAFTTRHGIEIAAIYRLMYPSTDTGTTYHQRLPPSTDRIYRERLPPSTGR